MLNSFKVLIIKYKILGKYIITGGVGTFANLFLLYLFTAWVGWWYFFSEIIAFIIAINISFILQKFWTFSDNSTVKIQNQFAGFYAVGIINLFLNAGLIYFFVEFFGLWYMISQILASVVMAVSSFFMYKYSIFNQRPS